MEYSEWLEDELAFASYLSLSQLLAFKTNLTASDNNSFYWRYQQASLDGREQVFIRRLCET